MNLFSKLFTSSNNANIETDPNPVYESVKSYCEEATFYENALIFQQSQQRTIKNLMIHPKAGIVIFNYFNFHARDLEGVTASLAKGKKTKADVLIKEVIAIYTQKAFSVLDTLAISEDKKEMLKAFGSNLMERTV